MATLILDKDEKKKKNKRKKEKTSLEVSTEYGVEILLSYHECDSWGNKTPWGKKRWFVLYIFILLIRVIRKQRLRNSGAAVSRANKTCYT